MKAGSTITSRDSHDVRHFAAARHARSGRPRWKNDAREPGHQQHAARRAAGANERGAASRTPPSSAERECEEQALAAPARRREEDDREGRVH